jgi:hypothetical protein
MNRTYDVALWHYWPTTALPYTDDVEAESPLLAVLSLMQAHNLKHVAYAAVRLPDGTFQRYQTGVSLYTQSSTHLQEEEVIL